MGVNLLQEKFENFTGGINTFVNKTQVRPSESPDSLNIDFVGYSAFKKRSGFIKYTSEVSSAKRIRGLFNYNDGSVNSVLYTADTHLYSGTTPSAVSGGTFTDDLDATAAQVGDRLYIVNGTDTLSYYNGSVISTTGVTAAPTKAEFCAFYNKRLYTNSADYPDRIYFGGALTSAGASTNTGNFTSGASPYGGYIGFGQGRVVRGMARFGSDYLYVWLDDGIYRISPVADTGVSADLDHSVELVTNSYGCVSHKSIDQVENDVFFLSEDGVYSLGEQPNYVAIRTKELSARIKSLITAIPAASLSRASAIYYKGKYYLSITEGTYNDHVLIYDTRYQSWIYWDGLQASNWLSFRDSTGLLHLYFGSDNSSNSYVYEADQGGNDDGSAISWYYYTKSMDSGDFSIKKKYQDCSVQFGPVYGEVDIDVIIDETEVERTMTVGTSSDYADGIGVAPIGYKPLGLLYNTPDGTEVGTLTNDWVYFKIRSKGNMVQLKFSGDTLDEGGQIEKAYIAYQPFKHYVGKRNKIIT